MYRKHKTKLYCYMNNNNGKLNTNIARIWTKFEMN